MEMYPVRVNIGLMCFVGCLIAYMLRVNLSINILAMRMPNNSSEVEGNSSITALPDYGPRYHWTPYQESLLLGAYFWGYLVTSAESGIFAEWFGGRALVGYTLIVSAVFTAAGPLAAASGNFWILFTTRFMVGVFGGPIYPSLHYLIAHWAPPAEKGKFIASLMGNACGTIITWPLVSILIEYFNWSLGFYVPAAITFITALIWFYLVANSPAEHPRIKPQEREYIEKSMSGLVKQQRSFPRIIPMITSLPFWSLLFLQYGNLWGLYFLLTASPKYMSEVLEFNLSKTGFLSALPYLARMLFGFVFGAIGDIFLTKNILSKTMIRKSFCLFSHIIPGLLLIVVSLVGDSVSGYVCVALITLSLGFNGASTMTNLQNSQDLAPNYAGTVYGIVNFVGTTSGFITPLVVSHFTAERSTAEEWKWVFIIGAIVYIAPGIFFMIFGTAEIQKWNYESDEQSLGDMTEPRSTFSINDGYVETERSTKF